MKTFVCFALGLFSLSLAARAQSPVQEVIDNTLIQQTVSNTQNIMSMLQQQLDEAQKQTQALNDQLTRMGNPAAVTVSAMAMIKQDVEQSAQAAANGVSREDRIRATTGAEAFGDNAYGLVPAVNATVTFDDGTTADRDPALYKLHGALIGDINALAQKSQETDQRITDLEQQKLPLLDQLSTAKDEATILKVQAALNLIDNQIASAKADLTKSKLDYDVLNEKLKLQAMVEARAKGEQRKLEKQHTAQSGGTAGGSGGSSSTSSPSGSSTTTTSPFSGLGWGKTTTP